MDIITKEQFNPLFEKVENLKKRSIMTVYEDLNEVTVILRGTKGRIPIKFPKYKKEKREEYIQNIVSILENVDQIIDQYEKGNGGFTPIKI